MGADYAQINCVFVFRCSVLIRRNLKWPDINYTNVTFLQFNAGNVGLLWLLWLLEGSDLCPQTNPLWENVFVVTWGRVACWAALAPQGVCSWEGLLFREHPEPSSQLPPPPRSGKVCCIHGQRELGKPQGRQFVAVEVNIAKWVEKKKQPGLSSVW